MFLRNNSCQILSGLAQDSKHRGNSSFKSKDGNINIDIKNVSLPTIKSRIKNNDGSNSSESNDSYYFNLEKKQNNQESKNKYLNVKVSLY